MAEQSDPGYTDVSCSFCDRHNREVHMVGGRDGLIICAVCVARCAEFLDRDTGIASPDGGWSGRWPSKPTGPPSAARGATSQVPP
jgi:hypothetical protein